MRSDITYKIGFFAMLLWQYYSYFGQSFPSNMTHLAIVLISSVLWPITLILKLIDHFDSALSLLLIVFSIVAIVALFMPNKKSEKK